MSSNLPFGMVEGGFGEERGQEEEEEEEEEEGEEEEKTLSVGAPLFC